MPPVRGNVCEPLVMEYESEELSPAQKDYYSNVTSQLDVYKRRFDELSKMKDVHIEDNGTISFLEFIGITSVPLQPNNASLHPGKTKNPLILQPNSNLLVVDPNLGLVVSPMPSNIPTSTPGSVNSGIRFTPPTPNAVSSSPYRPYTPRIRGRGRGGTAFRQRNPSILKSRLAVPATLRERLPTVAPKDQKPSTSESDKNCIVDLTEEDNVDDIPDPVASRADTKEVTIAKNAEKTFPSLVVVARPFLAPKEFTNQQITLERNALDERVKQMLTLPPPQFTEWLLQHGMLRAEQHCTSHGKGKTHQALKLGMYSDSSKFPFSGGYVWISECCASQFVSVFAGSLFEATPHPPTVIIKLIYHWACQTAVQNVIQWVKVDNLYVKTLYTNLRAVCTAAIHQKFTTFGGPGKKVQIGVISLGTTAPDGSSRQVKVEVLGLLDESSKLLRIRAIEPIQQDPSVDQQTQMKRRFQKTLELLPKWVHKSSEIIIDYTVDKSTLVGFGYPKVTQVPPGDESQGYKIMDYLRKIIPRMFQNTLSLLSRQIIQQFLDELAWRESFGPIPSRAFESIIDHISEQTRINTGGTLLNRLSRISLNPFKNWEYDRWAINCKTPPVSTKSISQKSITPAKKYQPSNSLSTSTLPSFPSTTTSESNEKSSTTPLTRKGESSDPAMIALEPYYYGVLEGDTSKQKYVPFFTTCYVCRADFKNVLKLTDHLILHALNKNLESVSDPKDICRVCLKIRLPGSKQHHLQMCQPGPLNPGCRICCLKLKDKGSLVYHMTKTHHQLDMPYLCNKCNYRVSELEHLNNHFMKVHHNGISGMCPFCLKIIDFATPSGDDLEHNQIFFIKHIQRHVLPSSKKCSRCLLNFVNKSILAAHEVKMHASCAENEDVMRYLVDDPTLMPAPIMEPPLVHAIQPGDVKPTGLLKGISTVSLGVVANIDDDLPITCCECESPVNREHFVNYLMCNKCSFRTCCSHSMAEHVSLIHPPYPLSSPVYVGMKITITQKTYCNNCSFSTRDGNRMSNHLVTCGGDGTCVIGKRRTIFSDKDAMALQPKARKKRGRKLRAWTQGLDEGELEKPVTVQPKSVLNVLGLMRKSTDDETSQEPRDAAPSEADVEMADPGDDDSVPDASAGLLEIDLVEGTSNVYDNIASPSSNPSNIPVAENSNIETEVESIDVD